MNSISRRSFLQAGARLSVLMGLGISAAPRMAEALESLAKGQVPVLWLQGQSCSGCSISLLNSESVTPLQFLTQYISLGFHQTLSSATGNQAVDTVNKIIEKGGYILIVEGSIPEAMPRACVFGEEDFPSQITRAAKKATTVIAIGTCASFGGVPAAEGNPTGAIGVPAFLKKQKVPVPVIRLPGCPNHPARLVGTVAHMIKLGMPPTDDLGRPTAFYSKTLHEQCLRFADYERQFFARKFGEDGCLFRLGCQGPITKDDCNLRQWNGGTNTCIRSGGLCIGCASEGFAAKASFAFITKKRAETGDGATAESKKNF